MSKERNAELIMVATQALRLRDIVLFDSHFARGNEPPGEPQLLLQHKRGTRFTRSRSTADLDHDDQLQVGVRLGYRVVHEVDGEQHMVFEIEAEFLAHYTCVKELPDDAIRAFADLNSVHIVWPFWRQHVFDIVARARLPQFDVPLLSGTRL